jgi:segregation and condensation protein A
MSFEINIPFFNGPFDLLLFFIERDELDIKDIPISTITNDFLAYLKHLEQMEMEVASEFILVASTLMSIKAKMLLPRPELDEQGNEIDPREELIRHLLEYKKYKSVVESFVDLEQKRLLLEKRGNIAAELREISTQHALDTELQDLDLFRLLKVYMKAMHKFEAEKQKPVHTIVPFPYTIEMQKAFLIEKVRLEGKVAFTDLMFQFGDKIAAIFNFLSILELLQLNQLKAVFGEGFNNFWIELPEAIEA